MFKNLKRRFIAINLLSVMIVLIITFIIIGITTKKRLYRTSIETLTHHLNIKASKFDPGENAFRNGQPPQDFLMNPSPDMQGEAADPQTATSGSAQAPAPPQNPEDSKAASDDAPPQKPEDSDSASDTAPSQKPEDPDSASDTAPSQKPEDSDSASDAALSQKPEDSNFDRRQRPNNFANEDRLIVLSLCLSSHGAIVSYELPNSNDSLTEEEMDQLADTVFSSKENTGTISSMNLRYMKLKTEDETYCDFYNLTSEIQTMQNLVASFFLVGIISLLAFFFINLFLANWCLRPVVESWKQQKQFIADASHELKTPLTVMLANTEILKAAPNATISSKAKWITYIEEEAQHMSRLVNDMLFLAKSDALRQELTMETIDFSELCMNSYLPFEAIAFEKGSRFDSHIEENISIKGDRQKLEQLLSLLLDNACKYVDDNGKISLTLTKHHHSSVRLIVNNTGEPIPPEHIKNLFKRFYRVDEARTRSQNGYGLGLSIAQSIVELHHGKIKVESNSSDGTSFIIDL